MSIDSLLLMPGSEFLAFYFTLFVLCWAGGYAARSLLQKDFGMIIPLIFFELVGGAKLISALSRGKQNVTYLLLMMIFGGIVMMLKYLDGSASGGGGCSSCTSSSCSGGGCGGGGCGGCGG